jgi:hypothetical protein
MRKRVLDNNKQIGQRKIHKEGVKSIKDSKIVVPIWKAQIHENIRLEMEKKAKALGKDPSSPFLYTNLYEINKKSRRMNLDLYTITWDHVLKVHLPRWISEKIDGNYTELTKFEVNKMLDGFFLYMPFIFLRIPGDNRKYSDEFDQDLSSPDYTKNHYSRFRFKEEFQKEIIDKLSAIEIIILKDEQ